MTITEAIVRIDFLVVLLLGAFCGLVGARIEKVTEIHTTIDKITLGAAWAGGIALIKVYSGDSERDHLWILVILAGAVVAEKAMVIVSNKILNKLNGKTGDK